MPAGTQVSEPAWVGPTHQALVDAGVTIIGHVPDGGLRHLIIRIEADDRFTTVRLTTEEEGVALMVGAHLGGARSALLMQSSGVGNCTNMLGLLKTCEVPGLVLVTMRGQAGESNPWQNPMGEAAAASLELMGVDVRTVDSSDAVVGAVSRACTDTFEHGVGATAVVIDQQVIGVKKFSGDDGPAEVGSR
jgi:sulfopyruvate decarboxylase TPP-binding subunit